MLCEAWKEIVAPALSDEPTLAHGPFVVFVISYHEKYENTQTFKVALPYRKRVRVMDRFDNYFLDEGCKRVDSSITLSSLIDRRSYAGAWGCQGE